MISRRADTSALKTPDVGFLRAALVFRPEMQKATFPGYFVVDREGRPDAPAADIIRALQAVAQDEK